VLDEVKTITVDVNVVIRNKITNDQVFQEKEPWTNKSIANWEKDEKLKEATVKII
jgi:hypothetical protein